MLVCAQDVDEPESPPPVAEDEPQVVEGSPSEEDIPVGIPTSTEDAAPEVQGATGAEDVPQPPSTVESPLPPQPEETTATASVEGERAPSPTAVGVTEEPTTEQPSSSSIADEVSDLKSLLDFNVPLKRSTL